MADQLSLFPEKDLPAKETPVLQGEISALDEMFTAGKRYRDSVRFVEMLRFISRFPNYSAFNGFLLYLQNPDATHVATAGAWIRRFGREPIPDARPLMILAPMAPVRFLFDVTATRGEPLVPDILKPPVLHGRLLQDVHDKTVENCSVHGIAIGEVGTADPRAGQVVTLTYNTRKQYKDLAPDAGASYLIALGRDHSLKTRLDALIHGLGHIFCGHLGIDSTAWWHDRRGVDQQMADIEAEAVAYLVLARKGLTDLSEKHLADYTQPQGHLLPVFSLNGVFQATQYIEEMGKSQWQAPKKKSRYL